MCPIVLLLLFMLSTHALGCPEAELIRFASYNIHSASWIEIPKFWRFRRSDVQDQLKILGSDLVAIQEVEPNEIHDLSEALPEFGHVPTDGSVQIFYRSSTWSLVRFSDELQVDGIQVLRAWLQSKQNPLDAPIEIWNLWQEDGRESSLMQAITSLSINGLLIPDFISVSIRESDHLKRDADLWSRKLNSWHLKQAAPELLRITTNGWWAEKWVTHTWHDTILSNAKWQLDDAHLIQKKYRGTYPSNHFPLQLTYCKTREKKPISGNIPKRLEARSE